MSWQLSSLFMDICLPAGFSICIKADSAPKKKTYLLKKSDEKNYIYDENLIHLSEHHRLIEYLHFCITLTLLLACC